MDIYPVVAIHQLLNIFPMPEEFPTGLLPPSAGSQELLYPASLAGRELIVTTESEARKQWMGKVWRGPGSQE